MAEAEGKYEVGETSTKNQTADEHVPEELQFARNETEAKRSKGYLNRRLINWRILSCHHLMGPCVLNTAKASKQSKTVLIMGEDGMENLVRPRQTSTKTKNQMADGKSVSKIEEAVEDLRSQRDTLTLARDRLQLLVEAAKEKEYLFSEAENWLTEADNSLDDAQILETELKENRRLFFNMFPNWRWRYRLSKQVAKMMVSFTTVASKFEQVRPLKEYVSQELFLSEDFVLFGPYSSALKKIMDLLIHDRETCIGLRGVGGVGKTVLVKVVKEMATKLKLFEKVVMVDMSPPTNIMSIQDEIANSFKFTFEDQGADRNHQLKARLLKENKILIIVDDLWSLQDLEDVGIPTKVEDEHSGSKLLLTTRRTEIRHDFLLKNQTYVEDVELVPLTDAEALDLFKMTAGLNHTSAFNEVAIDIVKKCKGLPNAIRVAAKALRGKTLQQWKEASVDFRGKTLQEWQRFCESLGRPELIDKSFEEVYSNDVTRLQLYYDRMSREGQMFFLLCSLFPEDGMHLEDLVSCAIGMDLYGNRKIQHYWNELFRHVYEMEREYSFTVAKMNNDVALQIASKEEEFKIRSEVGLKEWPRNESFEIYTAISMLSTKIKELDEGFDSKQLKILLLGGDGSNCMTISSESKFFERLTALKVIILSDAILSLSALKSLTDLRVLRLKQCQLQDISSLAELKSKTSLEVLCFRGSNISELPEVIGELNCLRLLDISECQQLQKIHPNVIEKLCSLQELLIGDSFENWHDLGETNINAEDRTKNASLSELQKLSNLCRLSLKFRSVHLPEGFVFPRLEYYQIAINEIEWFEDNNDDSKSLKVSTTSSLNALKELLPTVRDLYLNGITGYQNLLPNSEISSALRSLSLRCCQNMECIVDATSHRPTELWMMMELFIEEMIDLKELCKGQSHEKPFSTLQKLTVTKCNNLIVALSGVDLRGIKEIRVKDCDQMEQVYSGENLDRIDVGYLTNLELVNLRNLRCIWNSNLGLKFLLLRNLEITNCPKLETVFGSTNFREPLPMLLYLQRLVLRCLKNLRSFCEGSARIRLPSLEELVVEECPKLTPFIFPLTDGYSVKYYLKELRLSNVGNAIQSSLPPEWDGNLKLATSNYMVVGDFEEIFQVGGGYPFSKLEKLVVKNFSQLKVIWKDPTQMLTFQILTYFELANCRGIINIFSLVVARNLPQLRHLKVLGCDKLEQIITQDDQVASSSKAHCGDIYFPNLITVHVESCKNLKSLFPICVSNLPNLQEFRVKDAPMLKQIFASEGEADVVPLPDTKKDETVLKNEKEIELPNLKYLVLEDLISLLSFIPLGYHFKFPSLFSLAVTKCPNNSTIFSRDLNNTLHAKTKKFQDTFRELSADNNGDLYFGQQNNQQPTNLHN